MLKSSSMLKVSWGFKQTDEISGKVYCLKDNDFPDRICDSI